MELDLLPVLTFFVFLAAVAMVVQAGMLFGIWKASKALQQQVTGLQQQATSLIPQARSIMTKAEATIDDNRKTIVDITAKANEITAKVNEIAAKANQMAGKANEMMDTGKVQLARLDDLMADATARAKVQLERADLVLDDTVTRVHESVTAVHNGILRPIREIQGMTTGVRAAVQHFLRGGRPSVDQATQDDEMFI
jgi:hypothetical protein